MIRTPADVGIEAARADDNARASRISLTPSALTEWRERLGYSQREAALVIGCSRGRGRDGKAELIPSRIISALQWPRLH